MITPRRTHLQYNHGILDNDETEMTSFRLRDTPNDVMEEEDITSLISNRRGDILSYNVNPVQRSMLYKISSKGSGDYKRIDVMYRFYRICNSLKIPNPDRIYKLFLTRLNKRIRLESSSKRLEIVVSALYYIDQRKSLPRSHTLRDILSRIPDCKINLKKFCAFVSKMSRELGISTLPNTDYSSIISNFIDQLRTYCSENMDSEEREILIPKSTTTVLLSMNEFYELDRLMGTLDEGNSDLNSDKTLDKPEKSKKRRKSDATRCKIVYKLLSLNYEKVENLSLRILKLVEDNNSSEDFLDPVNRIIFNCRKTLISCVLFVSILALKIPVNANLMIKSLNVVKSSFYRNYNKVISKLTYIFSNDYNCKINGLNNLLSLILVLTKNQTISKDVKDSCLTPNLTPDKINDTTPNRIIDLNSKFEYSSDNLMELTPKILKVDSALTKTKSPKKDNKYSKKDKILTFSKAVTCLNFFNNLNSDSLENKTPKSQKVVIIYEKGANRYVCRYTIKGKIRRKCFSLNYHGPETALKLAKEFSRQISG